MQGSGVHAIVIDADGVVEVSSMRKGWDNEGVVGGMQIDAPAVIAGDSYRSGTMISVIPYPHDETPARLQKAHGY